MLSPHKVDIRNIDEEGNFPCPNCSALISPDDMTDKAYTVLESVIAEDDSLESVIIRCNGCNAVICIDGFVALSDEVINRVMISEALAESKQGYISSHTISFDGQPIGNLVVEYAQKEDVQAFSRLRNIHVGEAFKCIITIVEKDRKELKNEDFGIVVKAIKKKFKGIREGDTYIIEEKGKQKNLIGRF